MSWKSPVLSWVAGLLVAPIADAMEPATPQGRVVVFATHAHPVDVGSREIELYFVDEVKQLEEAFSLGMPDDPEAAQYWAKEKLAGTDGQQFMRSIGPAAVGLSLAWQWGVEAIPAVVFEQGSEHFVVYGATTLAAAEAAWQGSPLNRDGEPHK